MWNRCVHTVSITSSFILKREMQIEQFFSSISIKSFSWTFLSMRFALAFVGISIINFCFSCYQILILDTSQYISFWSVISWKKSGFYFNFLNFQSENCFSWFCIFFCKNDYFVKWESINANLVPSSCYLVLLFSQKINNHSWLFAWIKNKFPQSFVN